MKTLRRIFRLWKVYAYLDFMLMTRDLKTFLMWYGSDLVLNLASIASILLLAERFAGIGIWSKFQVLFMLGYGATVSGIIASLFSYNIVYISRRLGRGQLDHTLIQPQPLWMALLTEGFSPLFGSAMLLPGIGLMGWALRHLGLAMTPAWLFCFGLSLFASTVVVLAFQFLWGSLAFWSPRGAEEISSSTMHLMDQLRAFPLDSLGGLLTSSLLSVLPVGFVAWLPCRSLLGLESLAAGVWRTPAAALVFSLLALLAFHRGFQHYGRTGSRRYTDFGHRS